MKKNAAARARGGNATVIAVLMMLVIGSLVGLVLTVTQRHSAEANAVVDKERAFFVAEAGANEALARFATGNQADVGGPKAKLELSGGEYWVDIVDNADDTFTLTTFARAGLQEKAIEVVVEQEQQGVYNNGIFAGNSSNDPSYVLPLSGLKTQADKVTGDIYSGGSVTVSGDATVD
ncbi:MAG: hypothetical protein ABL998_16245, partial [Planctomycetota bacterium]